MRKVKRGFTIIEFVIVVAVLALLCAIIVPNIIEAAVPPRFQELADNRTRLPMSGIQAI